MNKIIKQLAEQADAYAQSEYKKWKPTADFSGVPNIRNIFNAKFSELIVLEFVELADGNMNDILDQPVFNPTDELWNRARVMELTRFNLQIKKHFGIK